MENVGFHLFYRNKLLLFKNNLPLFQTRHLELITLAEPVVGEQGWGQTETGSPKLDVPETARVSIPSIL
ncbi:hypothetical protein DMR_09300 [Solidesulfovibrio magneticus RS-1]|uniref:Uncharacterized protein n=1 Tax=Solidesulfovibrio magneticus (strain ATCC 700980 / DSM 13731 / RS-1) TaxID=573370 RepID=C4XKN0_SOLM1|nr:hypothetical protein DMR_09300 [Solidesulfovibrio magneticus RS-1]